MSLVNSKLDLILLVCIDLLLTFDGIAGCDLLVCFDTGWLLFAFGLCFELFVFIGIAYGVFLFGVYFDFGGFVSCCFGLYLVVVALLCGFAGFDLPIT